MSYSYHIPLVIQELFLFFFSRSVVRTFAAVSSWRPSQKLNLILPPSFLRACVRGRPSFLLPARQSQLARQHCFTCVSKTKTCVNGGAHPAVQELIAIRMRIAYPGRTNRGASSAGGSRKSVNQ